MRLLRTDCEELVLKTFNDERQLPKYAILSHTWLQADGAEVIFDDLTDLDLARNKPGWKKLEFIRRQAFSDGFCWAWIDTCCINKSSSAELAEAINSMYRWYQKSEVCYVYFDDILELDLSHGDAESSISADTVAEDMSGKIISIVTLDADNEIRRGDEPTKFEEKDPPKVPQTPDESIAKDDGVQTIVLGQRSGEVIGNTGTAGNNNRHLLRSCRWFSRGWTLQELLAPSEVRFFTCEGVFLGSLADLTEIVAEITGIHIRALNRQKPVLSFSIAQRMSWASRRHTTKAEDQAYCLLGIFGVNIPIVYGEGEGSFLRLQEELLRVYSDHTIFAWSARADALLSPVVLQQPSKVVADSKALLAIAPRAFKNCGNLVPASTDELHKALEVTGHVVRIKLFFTKDGGEAILNCRLEHDPTKMVCLSLTILHHGADMYYIDGEESNARIRVVDICRTPHTSKPKTIQIIRHYDRSEYLYHPLNQTSLPCRLIFGKGNLIAAKDVLNIHIAGGSRSSNIVWDQESLTFRLSCTEMHQNCSCKFSGYVKVLKRNVLHAQLEISGHGCPRLKADSPITESLVPRMEISYTLAFGHGSWARQFWLPETVIYHDGGSVVARLRNRELLYENTTVLEIEIGNYWLVCIHILYAILIVVGCVILVLVVFCWTMCLFITVAIPISAIAILRADSTLDASLNLALEIGLPVALLGTIVGLCTQDPIFSLGRKPISRLLSLGNHFQHDHRNMLKILLFSLNITLGALCGTYVLCSRQRTQWMRASRSLPSYELHFYVRFWPVAVAGSALYGLIGLWFLFHDRPLGRYRLARLNFKLGLGGKVACVATLVNLAVVIPLVNLSIQQPPTYMPWSTANCDDGDVSPQALQAYTALASATGRTFEEVCESFGLEGRMLYSILSLSLWYIIVNLWYAACVMWQIRSLKISMKRRLRIF